MISRLRPEATYRELLSAPAAVFSSRNWCDEFAILLTRELELPNAPILTASGRAALYYLFMSHPLDVVYLPAYTCWVVLEAARLAGKGVVFLDVDYPSFDVPADVYEGIRDRPGIVIATHQFGYPVDVAQLRRILDGCGHFIVEDCAGALFSQHRGRALGQLGDAAIYSFEMAKLWTIGGGALVYRDPELNERVRAEVNGKLRSGSSAATLLAILFRKLATEPVFYRWLLALYLQQHEPTAGEQTGASMSIRTYTTAFGNSQARLGMQMAKRIHAIVKQRRMLFDVYSGGIEGIAGLRPVPALPECDICPIRFPFLVEQGDKNALYQAMRARGVDLGFSFTYSLADEIHYPGAARIAREIMNLPVYSDITIEGARGILASLRAALQTRRTRTV
jgi:dTDP-4-amino-4,6-dideoxygalactose transaminase